MADCKDLAAAIFMLDPESPVWRPVRARSEPGGARGIHTATNDAATPAVAGVGWEHGICIRTAVQCAKLPSDVQAGNP